jgi:hypothetical protein
LPTKQEQTNQGTLDPKITPSSVSTKSLSKKTCNKDNETLSPKLPQSLKDAFSKNVFSLKAQELNDKPPIVESTNQNPSCENLIMELKQQKNRKSFSEAAEKNLPNLVKLGPSKRRKTNNLSPKIKTFF